MTGEDRDRVFAELHTLIVQFYDQEVSDESFLINLERIKREILELNDRDKAGTGRD